MKPPDIFNVATKLGVFDETSATFVVTETSILSLHMIFFPTLTNRFLCLKAQPEQKHSIVTRWNWKLNRQRRKIATVKSRHICGYQKHDQVGPGYFDQQHWILTDGIISSDQPCLVNIYVFRNPWYQFVTQAFFYKICSLQTRVEITLMTSSGLFSQTVRLCSIELTITSKISLMFNISGLKNPSWSHIIRKVIH